MTNREVLIKSLQDGDSKTDLCTVDYIACPSCDDCSYDGGIDTSMCSYCKAEWLNKEWET